MLFISHTGDLLGAETSLFRLLKEIDRKKIEPIVVIPQKGVLSENLDKINVNYYIHNCPWWVSKNRCTKWNPPKHIYRLLREIASVFKLVKLSKIEKFDLIYTNTSVNLSGALTARLTGLPHIWHVREFLEGNPNINPVIPIKLYHWLINKLSNKIIANSKATSEQFDKIPAKKTNVIYNPVPYKDFEKTEEFPKIAGVGKSDWIAVMANAIKSQKAQDDSIRAVAEANKNGCKIKLLLIGGWDPEGDYKKKLDQLTQTLGVEGKVIFAGYRDDVEKIMPHCKVVLQPSLKEGFGIVLLEAMASSIPAIGTNQGGTKEGIIDGETGFLVPIRAPEKIAEKLIFLYRNDDERVKMGERGRTLAKTKFSPEGYARKIESLIYNIAA